MHGTNGAPHSLPAPPYRGVGEVRGGGHLESARAGEAMTMLSPARGVGSEGLCPGASAPAMSLQVLELRACAQGAERGATVKSSNRDREDNAKTSERWPLCRLDGVGGDPLEAPLWGGGLTLPQSVRVSNSATKTLKER